MCECCVSETETNLFSLANVNYLMSRVLGQLYESYRTVESQKFIVIYQEGFLTTSFRSEIFSKFVEAFRVNIML